MPAILWADAVETGEALAETKTHLLQQAGLQVAEPPRCARTVAAALAAARVLCLNLVRAPAHKRERTQSPQPDTLRPSPLQEEASSLLPAAWDGRSSLSGRNDAAALSLLLQRARESLLTRKRVVERMFAGFSDFGSRHYSRACAWLKVVQASSLR